MRVFYVTHPNGAKERRVFWNDRDAAAYALELADKSYTPADGTTRDALQEAAVARGRALLAANAARVRGEAVV